MKVFICEQDINEMEYLESEIAHLKLENEQIKKNISQNDNEVFLNSKITDQKKNVFSCFEKCDKDENLFTVNFLKDS
jgi:hypothetical protein